MDAPSLPLALATAYTPGEEVGRASRWGEFARILRSGENLGAAGFGAEAAALADEERRSSAALRLGRGLVGTWVEGTLAELAAPEIIERLPPVLWISDSDSVPQHLESESKILVAGIGEREASGEALAFAREVGGLLREDGVGLVSGGARGCDAAFALGHGGTMAVLPHGIGIPRPDLRGYALVFSPFAPEARFSAERAMRRNAVVTRMASLVVVASAGKGSGGSWRAAVSALREGVPVAVYVGAGAGSGAAALVARGAVPVRDVGEALALASGRGELRAQPELGF